MSNAGPIPIQGCAVRISRLAADGSIVTGATDMVVDDKSFVKATAKPVVDTGVELNPKSACGALLISYKDFDREKRWDFQIDFGDFDAEKMEMVGGGSLITRATSAGRTVADGATTLNSTHITSDLANFLPEDVGRSATGTGIPATTFIIEVLSDTEAVLSHAATATGAGVSIVFGAIASHSIGYRFPRLLTVPNPYGVAIEVWQKLIVRGTGYQGTTGYPHLGQLASPPLTASAWLRWGFFRVLNLHHADIGIEDKESMASFTGFAIENPNFGTGPVHDWTETGLVGGAPIDTSNWCNAMADFQLPSPLQPGYQTVA